MGCCCSSQEQPGNKGFSRESLNDLAIALTNELDALLSIEPQHRAYPAVSTSLFSFDIFGNIAVDLGPFIVFHVVMAGGDGDWRKAVVERLNEVGGRLGERRLLVAIDSKCRFIEKGDAFIDRTADGSKEPAGERQRIKAFLKEKVRGVADSFADGRGGDWRESMARIVPLAAAQFEIGPPMREDSAEVN
jgi:hypothetical protein